MNFFILHSSFFLLLLVCGCDHATSSQGTKATNTASSAGSVEVTNSAMPSATSQSSPAPAEAAAPIIARIHWLGRKQLAAETNAAAFMRIWNMPESTRLENQTLDKLATAPWRLWTSTAANNQLSTNSNLPSPTSNQLSAINHQQSASNQLSTLSYPLSVQLRPLLDDLVNEESYLEIRGASNTPMQAALAIRLSDERNALWETNLAAVLESLTGLNVTNRPSGERGWIGTGTLERGEHAPSRASFRAPAEPSRADSTLGATTNLPAILDRIELTREGQWTLLALGHDYNELLERLQARIKDSKTPFVASPTNYWIEADVAVGALLTRIDLKCLRGILAQTTNLPQLSLRVIGISGEVETSIDMAFPAAVKVQMEPWDIPTNLVHDPISSFTAVRGFRPWLQALGWSKKNFGIPPNQAFFWGQTSTLPLEFFGIPAPDASNQVTLLARFAMTNLNTTLSNAIPGKIPIGQFQWLTNSMKVRWHGLPYLMPNVEIFANDGKSFVCGGLFENRVTNAPAPAALLQQFHDDSNLLLYDWEMSQTPAFRYIQAGQFGRLAFGRARLSITNNLGLPWIVAVAPKLGLSRTSVRLLQPNEINVLRTSSIGLTGAEIHLLIEWLESPVFPFGLFTLDSPPMPLFPDVSKPKP